MIREESRDLFFSQLVFLFKNRLAGVNRVDRVGHSDAERCNPRYVAVST